MLANTDFFRVIAMCGALDVSRGGYYSWTKRQQNPSGRQQRQEALDQQVKDAFAAGKKRSGSPRITLDLKDKGQSYDRKTVAASMQRQGLRAKAAKKFKATTNSLVAVPTWVLLSYSQEKIRYRDREVA